MRCVFVSSISLAFVFFGLAKAVEAANVTATAVVAGMEESIETQAPSQDVAKDRPGVAPATGLKHVHVPRELHPPPEFIGAPKKTGALGVDTFRQTKANDFSHRDVRRNAHGDGDFRGRHLIDEEILLATRCNYT